MLIYLWIHKSVVYYTQNKSCFSVKKKINKFGLLLHITDHFWPVCVVFFSLIGFSLLRDCCCSISPDNDHTNTHHYNYPFTTSTKLTFEMERPFPRFHPVTPLHHRKQRMNISSRHSDQSSYTFPPNLLLNYRLVFGLFVCFLYIVNISHLNCHQYQWWAPEFVEVNLKDLVHPCLYVALFFITMYFKLLCCHENVKCLIFCTLCRSKHGFYELNTRLHFFFHF